MIEIIFLVPFGKSLESLDGGGVQILVSAPSYTRVPGFHANQSHTRLYFEPTPGGIYPVEVPKRIPYKRDSLSTGYTRGEHQCL